LLQESNLTARQPCRAPHHTGIIQATMSEGLAQGPYMVARAGSNLQSWDRTVETPCPYCAVRNSFLAALQGTTESRSLECA